MFLTGLHLRFAGESTSIASRSWVMPRHSLYLNALAALPSSA